MAKLGKKRYINTRFWSDNFIIELNPLDRYLFLYFLTNEHTNISGIYELPLRTIAFESGLDVDMIQKMLTRLSGKIFYVEGWIYIKNFTKHQGDNESIKVGTKRALADVPPEIMAKIRKYDTACIHPVPSLPPSSDVSESESESKMNSLPDSHESGVNSKKKRKNMKKNKMGSYNESVSSDSYEEAIDLETGEIIKSKDVKIKPLYDKLIKWAVDRRGFPFVNLPKQYAALSKSRSAKIQPWQLKERWQEFENDDFRKKVGFDWTSVVSDFDKKK